jgi:uncharacterized membrane protein YraQ (UPF0718 family)
MDERDKGVIEIRLGSLLRGVGFVILVIALWFFGLAARDLPDFRLFGLVLVSIVLEAMPFLLIGTLISSALHLWVSEEWIQRIIPKNQILGVVVAASMGLVFPVCECAIVPVMRQLLRKGVPVSIALAFMMAVPIVNPVVIASTWFAFYPATGVAWTRLILGFGVAVTVGLVMRPFSSQRVLTEAACQVESHHHHEMGKGFTGRVSALLSHASGELFDMGRYFLMGAILSSFAQVFFGRELLTLLGNRPLLAIPGMIALAYALSLCSEADAFIARTFSGLVPESAVMAFLVFGPMMDLKNTLMLSRVLKPRFLVGFIAAVTITVIAYSLALEYLVGPVGTLFGGG